MQRAAVSHRRIRPRFQDVGGSWAANTCMRSGLVVASSSTIRPSASRKKVTPRAVNRFSGREDDRVREPGYHDITLGDEVRDLHAAAGTRASDPPREASGASPGGSASDVPPAGGRHPYWLHRGRRPRARHQRDDGTPASVGAVSADGLFERGPGGPSARNERAKRRGSRNTSPRSAGPLWCSVTGSQRQRPSCPGRSSGIVDPVAVTSTRIDLRVRRASRERCEDGDPLPPPR